MLEEPNEAAVPHEDPLLQDPRKRLGTMRAQPAHPQAHAMPTAGPGAPLRGRTLSARPLRGGGVDRHIPRRLQRRRMKTAQWPTTLPRAARGVPFKLVGVGGHWHP